MPAIATAQSYEALLHEEVARYYADPLGFALAMFPWGEPGPLQHHQGPDEWQIEVLRWIGEQVAQRGFDGHTPVKPIRCAISSGHGVGKSVLAAIIVCWILSTRPYAQGTVTANSIKQLDTKTWARLQLWASLCRTGHWFTINSEQIYHKAHKANWFASKQSSDADNSTSFAGQHAESSTSFYVNDEDSEIEQIIHDVEEGGLTDGEPMIFLLGNCTMSSGPFYEAVFGRWRHRWKSWVIDSRNSRYTNKDEIAEWIKDFGLDSDWVRVRVLGLPPNASEAQFIDHGRVLAAQKRSVMELPDTPLVAGCDLAWGGSDDNVIRFRRGMDARSVPSIRIKGEFTRDPGVLTNRLADVLTSTHGGYPVSMLFLDSAGIAGPIAQRLRALGHRNVMEVNFGAHSPDPKYAYMRDCIWGRMKEWLATAAIDDHRELETDLVGPGLVPDKQQRVKLESKELMKTRGVDSPDDGDALALTFAQPVKVIPQARGYTPQRVSGEGAWLA